MPAFARKPIRAFPQEGDELGRVVEGVGDSSRLARETDRSPQLPGHLGDEERPGRYRLGVERRQRTQGGVVIRIREADREAKAVIQRGAAGPGVTCPPLAEIDDLL